jgi:uncharacterized membrane protein
MVELEKPSTKKAISTTEAALLDLFGLFLFTYIQPNIWLFMLFLCGEMCLIVGAIRAWGKYFQERDRYFQEYVGFEIERRLKEYGK